MRRKDKEITDSGVLEVILDKSQICRIALNDGEFPYIVPFNYGYKDRVLYFHSAKSGRKIDIIKTNNKASFEIELTSQILKHEQACNWTARYRSIMGTGTMEILTDKEDKKRGLDIIMAHYGRSIPSLYDEKYLENLVVLKLTIVELTGKQSGDWDHE